jgi:restriction system protein
MSVPDYQTLMRPVLAALDDGQDHQVAELRAALATTFALTEQDLTEMLPSGRTRTFNNRVGWAVTYLYRAGLLSRPRRSVYRITDRGREVLSSHSQRVDITVLDNFEEFRTFRLGGSESPTPSVPSTTSPSSETDETPEERMDAAFGQLRSALAAELLDRTMARDPAFFERLVIDVLTSMGYGTGQQLGGTGDGGFDGVIDEDRLGLDRIYVQAKRWANPVGRPVLQAFVGALAGRGASKGVFITTSTFTAEARTYAPTVQARVVLIDGPELARLMMDYGVGVSVAEQYAVKRLDLDYFADDDAPASSNSDAGSEH